MKPLPISSSPEIQYPGSRVVLHSRMIQLCINLSDQDLAHLAITTFRLTHPFYNYTSNNYAAVWRFGKEEQKQFIHSTNLTAISRSAWSKNSSSSFSEVIFEINSRLVSSLVCLSLSAKWTWALSSLSSINSRHSFHWPSVLPSSPSALPQGRYCVVLWWVGPDIFSRCCVNLGKIFIYFWT